MINLSKVPGEAYLTKEEVDEALKAGYWIDSLVAAATEKAYRYRDAEVAELQASLDHSCDKTPSDPCRDEPIPLQSGE